MLKSLAGRFSNSAPQRHALFLGASLFTIALVGYHFGTFDQAIHIPFLKKYADPTLYPGDKFFDLRFQHFSYFWFIFQPFYRLGVLEPAMFAAHVLATYLTFWALWTLSELLFHNPLAALLSLVAFAFPHVGFAGFPIFEFSLLNRTFVLPFLLWAIVLFLRERYLLAFALLGVMYNLHVVSVNFVLAMFLFDCLLEFRKVGWLNILLGLALFVICALPVLIWKAGHSPVDFTPRPEWFSLVARGTLYNLFYLIAPYLHILLATLSGLSGLALFVIGRLHRPTTPADRTVTHFIYAALIILGVQTITAQWLPITIIIQSQIIRAGLFILIFGYLYFGNYLAERTLTLGSLDFSLLASAYILCTTPIFTLIVWGWQRLIASARWRQLAAASALLGTFALAVVLVPRYNLWHPGIYVFGLHTPWYQAQLWARDNTPRETVFITPPEKWWFYESEWRVFSERSSVATLSELLETAFAPEYVEYWQSRFESVAPGALDRFRGDFFENVRSTAQAFYGLSDDDVRRVAQHYGASYLVVEKPHLRDFPVAYENERFVIYDLRAADGQ